MRFIVLTDIHPDAVNMLMFTRKWARELQAELLIVHYTFPIVPALSHSELKTEIHRMSRREALDKLKGFVAGELKDTSGIRYFVTTRNLETTIKQLYRSSESEVVFTALRDKNFWETLFSQSTNIKLAEEVHKIIIALPADMSEQRFKTLHVALKPGVPLNEGEFKNLLKISGGKTRKIRFFSVLKPSEDDREIKEYLRSLSLSYAGNREVSYEILTAASPSGTVKSSMLENGGVLVLQKGPRSFMDSFRRYFVHDLIHFARIPLVILP